MSVDALALLRIGRLSVPPIAPGVGVHVEHYGDASVVSTFVPFDAAAPDEFSLALRKQLGAALDAHDDPRGILIFPDVVEFHGKAYEAIVREVAASGFWAPKVGLDHVAARITSASPGTHEALLGEMIARLGTDAALELDFSEQVDAIRELAEPGFEPDDDARARLEALARCGAGFTERYRASVRAKVQADQARQRASLDSVRGLHERAERGEPLVSAAELGSFVEGGGADGLLANFEPALRESLEKELGSLELGEGDLGKALLSALRRTKS